MVFAVSAALALAIFLVSIPSPVQAETRIWTNPCAFPFVAHYAEHVPKMPIPETTKSLLLEMLRRTTIESGALRDRIYSARELANQAAKDADWAKFAKSGKAERAFWMVEELKHRGLQPQVLKRIQDSLAKPDGEFASPRQRFTIVPLKPGTEFNWMAYTDRHGISRATGPRKYTGTDIHNVPPEHKLGSQLKVYLYQVQDGVSRVGVRLFMPTCCGNLALQTYEIGLVLKKPAPEKDHQKKLLDAILSAPPLGERAVFRLNIWSIRLSKDKELLHRFASNVPGRQSRDLGDAVLAAFRKDEVARHSGECLPFQAQFFDGNLQESSPAQVWVVVSEGGEAKPALAKLVPKTMRVATMVCEGEGYVAIPLGAAWATEAVSASFISPWADTGRHALGAALRYPLSGSLKLCGPATGATCAGKIELPTYLSRVLHRPQGSVIDLHYVVE